MNYPNQEIIMAFNHPGEIHDEITKNMVISYPRNTEEEIAKRVIKFKRILKRGYLNNS